MKCRGLPFSASERDIKDFFEGCAIERDGVYMYTHMYVHVHIGFVSTYTVYTLLLKISVLGVGARFIFYKGGVRDVV